MPAWKGIAKKGQERVYAIRLDAVRTCMKSVTGTRNQHNGQRATYNHFNCIHFKDLNRMCDVLHKTRDTSLCAAARFRERRGAGRRQGGDLVPHGGGAAEGEEGNVGAGEVVGSRIKRRSGSRT